MLDWPNKDDWEVIDYGFKIEGMAEDDTIDTTAATVLAGTINIIGHNIVPGTKTTTTRIGGGIRGEACKVLVEVVMTSGQRVKESMVFRIAER